MLSVELVECRKFYMLIKNTSILACYGDILQIKILYSRKLNCRHANVCGVCIFNITNNGDSRCPNPDCFEVIVDTIAIRTFV